MLLMCFCILIILRTVIIAYVFTMNKGKQFDLAFFYMNRVYMCRVLEILPKGKPFFAGYYVVLLSAHVYSLYPLSPCLFHFSDLYLHTNYEHFIIGDKHHVMQQ